MEDTHISYETIHKSFNIEKEEYFTNYLNAIYSDLTSRNLIKTISKMTFTDYMKLPVFISEKLFSTFDLNNDGELDSEEFVTGMTKLFRGSFTETAELIFNFYDFNKDGIINKGDVKIVISHLPIKCNEEMSEYKSQLKGLADADSIVKQTFGNEDEMDLKQFISTIKTKNSDVYLQLLFYLYEKKPFTESGVNACKTSKKKLGKSKFLSLDSFPKEDEHHLIPSPTKGTSLESSEKYLSKLSNESTLRSSTIVNEFATVDSSNVQGSSLASSLVMDVKEEKSLKNGQDKRSRNLYKNKTTSRSVLQLNSALANAIIGDLEEVVYKFEPGEKKNTTTFKKLYIALHSSEISVYSSVSKAELISIHNLSGCFISEGDNIVRNKQTYYSIQIVSQKAHIMKFYFENKLIRDNFLDAIRKAIGYQCFSDHYKLTNEQIGKGSFGTVKLGFHKNTNEKVAIKIVNKKELKDKDYELIKRELDTMKMLKHRNLVRLIDHFEDCDFIYIVMEHLSGGDLLHLIEAHKGKLDEKTIATILKQIFNAIKYLNHYGVIHRDIKLENIMLKRPNDIKSVTVIDFGLTKTLGVDEKLSEGMGTIYYVAPEILKREMYNKEVDVWSVGIVAYALAGGVLPFVDENDDKVAKKIVYTDPGFPDEHFGRISEGCKKIIAGCLEKNPKNRMSIEEVLSSEWILKNAA